MISTLFPQVSLAEQIAAMSEDAAGEAKAGILEQYAQACHELLERVSRRKKMSSH